MTNVVPIGSWGDAVYHFERKKVDPGLPLHFRYSDYSTLLLTINWRLSKKRILSAIEKIINEIAPPDLPRRNARGRKDRDMLVTLERMGIMRLLHHFTLSELQMRVPEAWRLYHKRKWYEERRQGLKGFRRRSHYADSEAVFPVSWQTKAKQLPAK
ncbi:MAG: hypothetical protein ABIU29_10070 [Chthoniobacterales bacterium]